MCCPDLFAKANAPKAPKEAKEGGSNVTVIKGASRSPSKSGAKDEWA